MNLPKGWAVQNKMHFSTGQGGRPNKDEIFKLVNEKKKKKKPAEVIININAPVYFDYKQVIFIKICNKNCG